LAIVLSVSVKKVVSARLATVTSLLIDQNRNWGNSSVKTSVLADKYPDFKQLLGSDWLSFYALTKKISLFSRSRDSYFKDLWILFILRTDFF
jgi:hypothetical protein